MVFRGDHNYKYENAYFLTYAAGIMRITIMKRGGGNLPIINRKKRCANCFCETKSGVCPKCGYSRNTSAPDSEALPRGARLAGKYLIGGMIGRGGFGMTYLAFDIKTDKIITLKEYFPMNIAVRERKGFMVQPVNDKKAAYIMTVWRVFPRRAAVFRSSMATRI